MLAYLVLRLLVVSLCEAAAVGGKRKKSTSSVEAQEETSGRGVPRLQSRVQPSVWLQTLRPRAASRRQLLPRALTRVDSVHGTAVAPAVSPRCRHRRNIGSEYGPMSELHAAADWERVLGRANT